MNRNGNPAARSGVYTGMCHALPALFCLAAGLLQAQPPAPAQIRLVPTAQNQQTDPISARREAFWNSRREGRFADAAASRNEARAILRQLPVEPGRFSSQVQQVVEMYQSSGLIADARAVLDESLTRIVASDKANPDRSVLLGRLAQAWQQDGNLLKAAACQELVVAEAEKPQPSETRPTAIGGAWFTATTGRATRVTFFGPEPGGAYQQLAELYRQLGRRSALEGVAERMRQLAGKYNDGRYALFFQTYGQPGEAEAMFRQQIAVATNPQQAMNASQQLANFYASEQRFDEAVATIQGVITSARSSGLSDTWPRQTLISILNQAGRTDQVETVYQEMLAASTNREPADQFQVLLNYAGYLSSAKRGAQAEAMLQEYRSNHPNTDSNQDWMLLNALSNASRSGGDQKRADEFLKLAQSKQPHSPVSTDQSVTREIARAQSAVQAGNTAEALEIALHAIDGASTAPDRDQIGWMVPSLAFSLAQKKAVSGARQLYERLFSELELWGDNPQPLASVNENYVRFLFSQRDHWVEVPAALDRYRTLLTTAHGSESSAMRNVLQMTMEFENLRNAPDAALQAARDIVALEETLSGNSSESYLSALRALADSQIRAGQTGAALATYQKRIAIADAGFTAKELIRGYTRTDAAHALARQGQFDEAELLAAEAVAMFKNRPREATFFAQQLESIHKMRLTSAAR